MTPSDACVGLVRFDSFLDKIEELVERSHGKVRADVVYDRLCAIGFSGDERTVRRAVAESQDRVSGWPPADLPTLDSGAGSGSS